MHQKVHVRLLRKKWNPNQSTLLRKIILFRSRCW